MDGELCCGSSASPGALALATHMGDSGQSSPWLLHYICSVSWLLVLAVTDLSRGMLIIEISDVFGSLYFLHNLHTNINESSWPVVLKRCPCCQLCSAVQMPLEMAPAQIIICDCWLQYVTSRELNSYLLHTADWSPLMLPAIRKSCRRKPTQERNLFRIYFLKDVQKTEIKIILRVLITSCLLIQRRKKKIPKLLETGPFQCSEVTLVFTKVVSENWDICTTAGG